MDGFREERENKRDGETDSSSAKNDTTHSVASIILQLSYVNTDLALFRSLVCTEHNFMEKL